MEIIMDTNNIKEKLIKTIKKTSQEELLFDIKDTTNIFTDLSFDSFKMITLLIEIESTFNVSIDEDDYDYEKISTIGELIKMIAGKVNG